MMEPVAIIDRLLELTIFLNEQIDNDKMKPTEIKEYVSKQCKLYGWQFYVTSTSSDDSTIVYDPHSKRKIVYNSKTFEYEVKPEKHVYYNKREDRLIESDTELIE